MLPDYPTIKKDLWKLMQSRADEASKNSPSFLSTIGKVQRHEGHRYTYETVEGDVRELSPQKHQGIVEVPFADIATLQLDDVQRMINQAYADIWDSEEKHLYQVINEMTEEVGNVISGNDKPLTQDLFFSAFEKIHMSFDDLSSFSIVANHDTSKMLQMKLEEWNQDPEFTKKWRELMEKKRRDWLDRESRRKLVD
ncbi:MAG: hypothetical protein ABFD64_01965 [Armatimonadota bacterium]